MGPHPARTGGILVVCSANVCRSVLTALLLERAVEQGSLPASLVVRSRGTLGPVTGLEVCTLVAAHRTDEGWREAAVAHRPTSLTKADVEDAGLVLTATQAHRTDVARMVPRARERVFTLREAAVLAEGFSAPEGRSGDELVRQFAGHLHQHRDLHSPPSRSRILRRPVHDGWSISDGHCGSARQHRATLGQVEESATALIEALRGANGE